MRSLRDIAALFPQAPTAGLTSEQVRDVAPPSQGFDPYDRAV